ncbi:MAG: dienelactone hydrolase family protein [Pseudomonadota bacterium]
MAIVTRPVDYECDATALEGVIAYDDASPGPRPVVLVSHAWAGRTAFETGKAEALAELGYAGFALDLYGKGVTGATTDECAALMDPFMKDRAMLNRRLAAALAAAGAQPEADAAKVAAIGFCFGGLCVLDMARAGADLKAVAAFHGLLGAPEPAFAGPVTSKIAVFHGWDDPMATPDAVVALGAELTAAKADWQLHAYGGVMHAFTNPQANDPGFGTVYDATAASRSWAAMTAFLAEAFAA